MDEDIITHQSPARRELSNFIIFADIRGDGSESPCEWEQLWALERSEDMFEICCIPFFAYGLALGDWVETKPLRGKRFVITGVVKRSGTSTYRVFFSDKRNWGQLIEKLNNLGCVVEPRWNESILIGIDVPQIVKQDFEALLLPRIESGEIKCELAN